MLESFMRKPFNFVAHNKGDKTLFKGWYLATDSRYFRFREEF